MRWMNSDPHGSPVFYFCSTRANENRRRMYDSIEPHAEARDESDARVNSGIKRIGLLVGRYSSLLIVGLKLIPGQSPPILAHDFH